MVKAINDAIYNAQMELEWLMIRCDPFAQIVRLEDMLGSSKFILG